MCLMIGLKQWPYGQLENFACVLHYYTQEWKPFSMGKFPTTLCALIYTLKLLKISASQKWKICSSIMLTLNISQVNTFNFSREVWLCRVSIWNYRQSKWSFKNFRFFYDGNLFFCENRKFNFWNATAKNIRWIICESKHSITDQYRTT